MKRLINILILVIVFLVPTLEAQFNQITLGNKQYILENNVWKVFDANTSSKYVVNTHLITVRLNASVTLSTLLNAIASSGITLKKQTEFGYIRLNLPNSLSFISAYNILNNTNLCSNIRVNTFADKCGVKTPNDPLYGTQYYLNNQTNDWDINAPEAWWWETGSNNVSIAIIDNSMYKYHPDYTQNMSTLCWNFVDEDNDPSPDNPDEESHGTAVTGIIGARTNNNQLIAGIAGGWESTEEACKIMGLRTDLDDDLIVDAVYYAANHGAKIINMSFTMDESNEMDAAIEYAYRMKGCLLVAAAGNPIFDYTISEFPPVLYPATHPDVMAVNGTYPDSRVYGRTGPELEICAPAYAIMTTSYTNGYDYWTGTSFSSPMVSGGAALLWSYAPNLINMDVRSLLKQTAKRTDYNWDELHYGKGLLRLDQALGPIIDPPYIIPLAPSNVALTGAVGQHPTISWSKVDEANHYNVYRSVDLDGIYHYQKVAEVVHNPNLNTHSWVDNSVTIASKYNATSRHYYRITTVDSNPYESITSNQVSTASNWAEKTLTDNLDSKINYNLNNAFPNPFNPNTTISYSLKEAGMVNLEVFNVLGEKVSVLVNGFQEAGINYCII